MLKVTNTKMNTIKFLQEQHTLKSDIICPGPLVNTKRSNYCGHLMILKNVTDRKDGLTWRCRKLHKITKNDRKYTVKDVKVSIRYNTWLESAKLTLEEIIQFIYLWTNGYSSANIQHELSLSNKCVIEWSALMRDTCMGIVYNNSQQIGGEGIHIEIDESKFGRRKYYKGHHVEGQWVFGGRERDDKTKLFMLPVHNRKEHTLIPLIQKWIRKGSIIHSDCWKAYSKLKYLGYTHVTVNHSETFKDPSTGACTNHIECEWRHAKVNMPTYGIHEKMHASYLSQFMWHRRYQDEDKFLLMFKHLNDMYQQKNISIPTVSSNN